jgi:septum formation protein
MLVLASASPRRHDLLRAAGIAFEVHPTDIPEIPDPGEKPEALAERLAREKAHAIAPHHPNDYILGADTVVIVGDEILGKPLDQNDAARMLRSLSSKTHHVITAVCLLGPRHDGKHTPEFEDTRSETTKVTMTAITDQEIRAYVETGEPMDKAGAYAIQGIASRWIPCIEGDYSNVVGLPVSLVYRMLQQHGVI